MNEVDSTSPETETTDRTAWMQTLTKFAPAAALIGATLYVLGLYTAYRMDSALGVGTIEVHRERAVCLGIILLVLMLPTILFWFNIRENLNAVSSKNFGTRFKAVLSNLLFPALVAAMLSVLVAALLGVRQSATLFAVFFLPLILFAIQLLQSPSNARRVLNFWPIFSLFFLSFFASSLREVLPMEFGGHNGGRIKVVMKNGVVNTGDLRASDSTVIVLSLSDRNVAFARGEILSIEAVPNDPSIDK
ncbi:MAG: hypothetical protein JST40_10410 [Armatimonadetes bacterium]|nr:hypothetical protein [Armatimonadota bacterium]